MGGVSRDASSLSLPPPTQTHAGQPQLLTVQDAEVVKDALYGVSYALANDNSKSFPSVKQFFSSGTCAMVIKILSSQYASNLIIMLGPCSVCASARVLCVPVYVCLCVLSVLCVCLCCSFVFVCVLRVCRCVFACIPSFYRY
jgi:hypothetical protein